MLRMHACNMFTMTCRTNMMLEPHGAVEITASVSRHVPPELFYEIFGLLNDDKDTLASCSCVSKYWRSLSLPWLFSRVVVPESNSFSSFLDFISAHRDLRKHIKTLRMIGEPSASYPIKPHLSLLAFLSIVSELSALRTLHLWDIHACDHPSTIHLTKIDRLPKLTLQELSIRNPRGKQLWTMTLTWLLTRYSVDTLELAGVRISDLFDGDAPACTAPSNRVSVRRLTIAGSRWLDRYSYGFFQAFLDSGSLESLSVRCPNPQCATYARGLLCAVGQNITKLCFDIAALSVHGEGEKWSIPNDHTSLLISLL